MALRKTDLKPAVIREAGEAMDAFDACDWMGLDLETGGLSPWKNEIAVVTLYSEELNQTAVIHTRGNLHQPEYAAFRDWLGSPRRKFVTHNGICFDIPFLAVEGVDVYGPQWFDTMVGEAVTIRADRHTLSKSLADTLRRRLKAEIDKSQQLSFWMAPVLTQEQVDYCCSDVQYLPNLRRKQLEEAHKDVKEDGDINKTRVEAMTVEMNVAPVVIRMMTNGMPIHLPSVEAYRIEQTEKAKDALAYIRSVVGDINLNSYKQVLGALADAHAGTLDRESIKLTSTAAPVLQELSEYGEGVRQKFAESLLVYRRAAKRESMFSPEWMKQWAIDHRTMRCYFDFPVRHDYPDVRWVHMKFKQLGTETGRFTSADPNGQQIPKDARKLFGRVPGHKIIACDYAQLEIRVAAGVADDETLIRTFAEAGPGSDIHRVLAARLFGCAPEEVTDRQRRLSKAASFTLLFGGSATLLYNYARLNGSSMTEKESWEVFRAFFDTYKGLKRTRNWAEQWVRKHSYYNAVMPYGLRRLLYEDTLTSTRILNTMVQGTAACGLKFALLECRKRGLDEYLCATVHDELVACVPDRYADKYAEDLRNAMIDGMSLVVPNVRIEAEYKIADTWK